MTQNNVRLSFELMLVNILSSAPPTLVFFQIGLAIEAIRL